MTSALSLGIVCFPSYGGSCVVATEVALGLARLGHRVHLISSAPPFRLSQEAQPEPPPELWSDHPESRSVETSLYRLPPRPSSGEILFHRVKLPSYPLFQETPYTLALATALAEVSLHAKLDLLHLHYAIPHAVSGFLARQILGDRAPRLVITLHGTDVTHVGSEPAYKHVTKMALASYDGLAVPSLYLRRAAYESLGLHPSQPIEILSNFVDTERFSPPPAPPLHTSEPPTLLHISNFRPIKRVLDAVDVFLHLRKRRRVRLLMIGDGPDRPAAEAKIHAAHASDSALFLGNTANLVQSIQKSSLLLLPSEMESFGLVALEALSCAVPVIASKVGGLPEVVRHAETGFLAPLGDTQAMADLAFQLLDDPSLWLSFSKKARLDVLLHWSQDAALLHYQAYYRRILAQPPSSSALPERSFCDHPTCTFHC